MKSLTVIGLNSGTSMDGIDAAAFRISPRGDQSDARVPDLHCEMLGNLLYPFDPHFAQQMQRLIARGSADLDTICRLNAELGQLFATAALELMKSLQLSRTDVDLIGSHGQTIWHSPLEANLWGRRSRGTLQLGEASVIAARTGVTVVSDFRTMDMALGGQGAPLVSFADEVLFGHEKVPLLVLNIGGIANMTVLDKNGEAITAFDTGPGNMLIDRAAQILFNRNFDDNGKLAAAGKVDESRLKRLLGQPYFLAPPPKTTGRELFGHVYLDTLLQRDLKDLQPNDKLATITALTAASIADAYKRWVQSHLKVEIIVLGGGGEANETLKSMIKHYWPHELELKRHEDFGISTKFKEALLFALLAYTTYFKIPNNVPACTGAIQRACLGTICPAP